MLAKYLVSIPNWNFLILPAHNLPNTANQVYPKLQIVANKITPKRKECYVTSENLKKTAIEMSSLSYGDKRNHV